MTLGYYDNDPDGRSGATKVLCCIVQLPMYCLPMSRAAHQTCDTSVCHLLLADLEVICAFLQKYECRQPLHITPHLFPSSTGKHLIWRPVFTAERYSWRYLSFGLLPDRNITKMADGSNLRQWTETGNLGLTWLVSIVSLHLISQIHLHYFSHLLLCLTNLEMMLAVSAKLTHEIFWIRRCHSYFVWLSFYAHLFRFFAR